MELVSSVIGFDIVELWSEDTGVSGQLHCTYIHANESLVREYPEIIVGHYPNHRKEHKLSPKVRKGTSLGWSGEEFSSPAQSSVQDQRHQDH